MKFSVAIVLTVLLILPFVACDEQASLQDAIARAITKTSEAQSYRSAGNSTTYDYIITYESSFELEYAAPDRWHIFDIVTVDGGESVTITTSVDYGNFTGTSSVTAGGGWFETIAIGDKGYMRSSREPQWRVCEVPPRDWQQPPHLTITPQATPTSTPTTTPTPMPSLPPPPGTPGNVSLVHESGWSRAAPSPTPAPTAAPSTESGCFVAHPQSLEEEFELLNWLVDLERLPNQEIDGVNCMHYRGRVAQDSYVDMLRKRQEEEYRQIPPQNLDLMRRREIVVELWIDGDDYIRQQGTEFRVPEPLSEGKWVTGFSTTRYFDFNEPICIEPPELESE